jgi:hypothetical protein
VTVSCSTAANFQSSTGGEELNCVALASGQQVFFFIDEATFGAGGTFYALVEQCGPMETEPNNTPATANSLSCGIQGQVNPATEADFYAIGAPAASSRLFAMVDASTAGPSADVDLRVNTATDTVEYDDLDSDVEFGVSGFAPIIAGTIATGAPLFYQVDRFGAAPTGNAFPYRLYSVIQPAIANATAESEPNDTTANASFAANNYFSGALAGPAPSTDADLYTFQATAGDLIMLIVDGDPTRNNTPVDTRLQLLDSTGATLVDVDGSGSTVNLDNANPPGLFETVPTFPSEGLLFRAPTTGTYFARVSAAVTGATGVGDYLLSITKNCTIGGGGFVCSPPITATSSLVNESCPPANGQIDPGERVTVTLNLTNNGTCAPGNLVATLLPGGGVSSASDPRSYGTLSGGQTANRDFSFTASASCGGMITATWQLTDGTNNLGTITQTFPVGCLSGCGGVRLVVSSNLTRVDANTVKATYQLQNIGTETANGVQLTNARLGTTIGAPLPQLVGDLAPASTSAPMDVLFTNSTPGASSTLKLDGTYTGGTFASTKRVTIP